jgi:hypothetical protein
MAQLRDPPPALVVHHRQELALVVKRILAQYGLELALALLCNVLHRDHKNGVHP